MKKLIVLLLVCFAYFAKAQTEQPDMTASNGKRAYIDLNPAVQTEIAPGLRTYFAWVKDPKSGNYYKYVSANEALFNEFDRVTEGVVADKKRQDSAIVVEGPPLDIIFTKELLYAYQNSPRILKEIKTEKSNVDEAQKDIDGGKSDRREIEGFILKKIFTEDWKTATSDIREAKRDLKKATKEKKEGEAKRQAELSRVSNLLEEMQTTGFVYLKNHALVAISDILTKELPTRVGVNAPANNSNSNFNSNSNNNAPPVQDDGAPR